jgi:hypothetical protein
MPLASHVPAPAQRSPQLDPTGNGVWWTPPASHVSTVQGLPSSMNGGAPGMHAPAPSHASTPLQMSVSAQLVPAGSGSCTGPVVELHESAVHALLSSTFGGGPPTHTPPVHVSAVVQALASLHAVPFGALPSAGHVGNAPLHDSARSHAFVAGRHTAPALPAGCWHVRLAPLHLSVVHGLPSSEHAVPLVFGEQVPAAPVKLHAPHSSVHAVSQQTPFAQKPLAHCVGVVHDEPREGS